MWGFLRSKKKPKPATVPGDTTARVATLLQGWLRRMEELVDARRTAPATEIAVIDERMNHLCQEAAEDIDKSEHSGLSARLLRMKQLTLEEMLEVRDKARREHS